MYSIYKSERESRIESLLFARPSFKSIYLAIFPNISIAHFPSYPIGKNTRERTSCPLRLIPPGHTHPRPPSFGFLATKVNGFDRGINSREIILLMKNGLRPFPQLLLRIANEARIEKSVVRPPRHIFSPPQFNPFTERPMKINHLF